MPTTAITAARMFDGTRMHGPSTVVVEDGRITTVDTSGAPAPDGMASTDLGDACLLPGLVDAHVHLSFDASSEAVRTATEASDAQLLDIMRAGAQRALRAGITTVRDLGDRDFLSLTLRKAYRQAPGSGPEILAAGPPITTIGGHCHFLGGAVSGADELRRAVQERYDRGCDVVKIMASGGNITPGSAPYKSQFSRPELAVVVDEAHRLGLPVAVHAHAVESIEDALATGADSIEHATFMTADGVEADPALLDSLAAAPVAISIRAAVEPGPDGPMPPAIAARLGAIIAALTGLRDRGATMVLSSDAGIEPNKPHDVLRYAVEQVVKAGWDPLGALAGVTSVAADACGVGRRKGRIRPGADADLLAVVGDPLSDPSCIRSVRAVYRQGVRVR